MPHYVRARHVGGSGGVETSLVELLAAEVEPGDLGAILLEAASRGRSDTRGRFSD
ncbi:MAG: hypothetical protein OXG37_01310 [Actinomycetia bacterium]|nr:hypothetical protein [Actinomycetes bacterium]